MNITEKQRKAIWITVTVLAILYYAPSVITWVHTISIARQQNAAQVYAQPQDARRQPPPPQPPPPDPIVSKLVGVWEGAANLPPARGFCTERLEVRQADDGKSFTGTSTLNCAPSLTMMTDPKSAPSILNAGTIGHGLDPLGAKLIGQTKGDSIEFTVDKVFGAETSVGHCIPTSFALSTFGTGTAGLDFEDSCGKHEMLLHRTAK